ncbi:hypothetical protein CXB51_031230 [Gossypium anomalum]|uniref:Uncharacterized protein n=1 Tax=Gossypium anomalum TaxID=47600 RepID=A0A8J5Y6R8_9ROSI|nr:hypothetical protein CXB51_031230 [Gossypium anomalum]
MGWLRDKFSEPDNDSTELERIRYARAYILEMIGGYLMLDLSRNRVHLRWLLKLVDFRAVGTVSLSIFTSSSETPIYIPTNNEEPIIVPELACVPEYMPWFRIHGRPYLLSKEERRRQIRVQMERRGPLNPRRRDDDAGPSVVATQSPSPSTTPTQPPRPTLQPTTPISQRF